MKLRQGSLSRLISLDELQDLVENLENLRQLVATFENAAIRIHHAIGTLFRRQLGFFSIL